MAENNTTKSENAKSSFNMKKFLSETKAEMKKVTWPDKEQLIHNTGVILVFILVSCVTLSVLDLVFQQLMQLVQKL